VLFRSIMMVLLGGFIYPIYALVVAHANDYADAEDFVKVSSGLLILYGMGNMVGPLITGPLMEYYGASIIFTVIGAAHLVLAAFVSYRVMVRKRPDDIDTLDFQVGPIAKGQTPESYALDPRADAEAYSSDDEE